VVLQSVVSELKRNLVHETRAGSHRFKIALDLLQRCRVVEPGKLGESIPVDDEILRYAITSGGVIATNDKKLKERALSQGTPVLYLRGRKQLQLIGFTS
jgi:rRNA-processing protein FCF1